MRNGGKHFCTPSTVVASSATVQSASPFARARERRLTTGRLGPRRRRAQGRVSGLCASSRSTPCIRRAKLAGDISNDVDVRGFADLSLKFSKRQNRPRSLQRLLSWRRGRRPQLPARQRRWLSAACSRRSILDWASGGNRTDAGAVPKSHLGPGEEPGFACWGSGSVIPAE